MFKEWQTIRTGDKKCPDEILEHPDASTLNFWLARFVAEVRRADGNPYPLKTIHQLICGLLHYMRSVDPGSPNVLDCKTPDFASFMVLVKLCFVDCIRAVLELMLSTQLLLLLKRKNSSGSGALNVSDPRGLQQAVFYYVGKAFCIRGGEEQRYLKPSQFVCSRGPDCYTCIEHGSKNQSEGSLLF